MFTAVQLLAVTLGTNCGFYLEKLSLICQCQYAKWYTSLSDSETQNMVQLFHAGNFWSPHPEPLVPSGRERRLVRKHDPCAVVPHTYRGIAGKSKLVLRVGFAKDRHLGSHVVCQPSLSNSLVNCSDWSLDSHTVEPLAPIEMGSRLALRRIFDLRPSSLLGNPTVWCIRNPPLIPVCLKNSTQFVTNISSWLILPSGSTLWSPIQLCVAALPSALDIFSGVTDPLLMKWTDYTAIISVRLIIFAFTYTTCIIHRFYNVEDSRRVAYQKRQERDWNSKVCDVM